MQIWCRNGQIWSNILVIQYMFNQVLWDKHGILYIGSHEFAFYWIRPCVHFSQGCLQRLAMAILGLGLFWPFTITCLLSTFWVDDWNWGPSVCTVEYVLPLSCGPELGPHNTFWTSLNVSCCCCYIVRQNGLILSIPRSCANQVEVWPLLPLNGISKAILETSIRFKTCLLCSIELLQSTSPVGAYKIVQQFFGSLPKQLRP